MARGGERKINRTHPGKEAWIAWHALGTKESSKQTHGNVSRRGQQGSTGQAKGKQEDLWAGQFSQVGVWFMHWRGETIEPCGQGVKPPPKPKSETMEGDGWRQRGRFERNSKEKEEGVGWVEEKEGQKWCSRHMSSATRSRGCPQMARPDGSTLSVALYPHLSPRI